MIKDGRFKGRNELFCNIGTDKGHSLDHNNHYQRKPMKPVMENSNDKFCVVRLYKLYTDFLPKQSSTEEDIPLFVHKMAKKKAKELKLDMSREYGDVTRAVGKTQYNKITLGIAHNCQFDNPDKCTTHALRKMLCIDLASSNLSEREKLEASRHKTIDVHMEYQQMYDTKAHDNYVESMAVVDLPPTIDDNAGSANPTLDDDACKDPCKYDANFDFTNHDADEFVKNYSMDELYNSAQQVNEPGVSSRPRPETCVPRSRKDPASNYNHGQPTTCEPPYEPRRVSLEGAGRQEYYPANHHHQPPPPPSYYNQPPPPPSYYNQPPPPYYHGQQSHYEATYTTHRNMRY